MPQRDPGVYLEDIEHYAYAAVRFVAPYSLEQYLADEKTRAAVERVLEICGEAMNGLFKAPPAIAQKIPHSRDIIGFRNILAHGYTEWIASRGPGARHSMNTGRRRLQECLSAVPGERRRSHSDRRDPRRARTLASTAVGGTAGLFSSRLPTRVTMKVGLALAVSSCATKR
jgi:uncharacterized protein with HEPN domain